MAHLQVNNIDRFTINLYLKFKSNLIERASKLTVNTSTRKKAELIMQTFLLILKKERLSKSPIFAAHY